jgi:hypothetical protein
MEEKNLKQEQYEGCPTGEQLSLAVRKQTNDVLGATMENGVPASELLAVHASGRALEEGDLGRLVARSKLVRDLISAI